MLLVVRRTPYPRHELKRDHTNDGAMLLVVRRTVRDERYGTREAVELQFYSFSRSFITHMLLVVRRTAYPRNHRI